MGALQRAEFWCQGCCTHPTSRRSCQHSLCVQISVAHARAAAQPCRQGPHRGWHWSMQRPLTCSLRRIIIVVHSPNVVLPFQVRPVLSSVISSWQRRATPARLRILGPDGTVLALWPMVCLASCTCLHIIDNDVAARESMPAIPHSPQGADPCSSCKELNQASLTCTCPCLHRPVHTRYMGYGKPRPKLAQGA